MNSVVRLEQADHGIALIRIHNPPVNALSKPVRQGLIDAALEIKQSSWAQAAVLLCDGNTFIAGADISEFEGGDFEPDMNLVLQALEDLPVPLLCVMQGAALGGGLETAMACHYRYATPGCKLGLPEVSLGLLPGAGGTQRLPRLVGVEKALQMMVTGKPIKAEEALKLGLIDELVTVDLASFAVTKAKELIDTGAAIRPTRLMEIADADAALVQVATWEKQLVQAKSPRIAPQGILQSVAYALNHSLEEGLVYERERFIACMLSDASKALRHLFFAERQTHKVPGISAQTPLKNIEQVAVIGAGTMGSGIAMCFADAGFSVRLLEIDQQALARGLKGIARQYQNAQQKGRISEQECEQRIGLIQGVSDYVEIGTVDLVVEAVFEDMQVKQAVFRALAEHCSPGTILATNTSTLDVNEIAAVTGRAEDVVGLHFFSPANIMRLLEIVRADHTSDSVLATALNLARRLRKIGVVAGVCYGFIGNRMLEGYIREAGFLLLEGASPLQVDRALTDFGMAMGPFTMGDLAGLDLNAKVQMDRQAKGAIPYDERYGLIIRRLVEEGRYGQKTGRGFYRYSEHARTPEPDPEVEALIAAESSRLGIERRNVTDAEIVERCIYPLIMEGARILDEGIALRASDVDVVWVYGYGFPAWRGGPLHYAQNIGVEQVAQSALAFAQRFPGDYWQVPQGLMALSK